MEKAEKEREQKLSFRFVLTRLVIENSKKITKQLKRQRKKENKNYRLVSFRPYKTRNRKFQKNSNKIQKIKKFHYGLVSSKNRFENGETERK